MAPLVNGQHFNCVSNFGFEVDNSGNITFDSSLLDGDEWKEDVNEWSSYLKHDFDFFDTQGKKRPRTPRYLDTKSSTEAVDPVPDDSDRTVTSRLTVKQGLSSRSILKGKSAPRRILSPRYNSKTNVPYSQTVVSDNMKMTMGLKRSNDNGIPMRIVMSVQSGTSSMDSSHSSAYSAKRLWKRVMRRS